MDVEPYTLLGQPGLLNRAIWAVLGPSDPFENPPGVVAGGSLICSVLRKGRVLNGGAVEATPQNESRRSFSCTCAILRYGVWISR